jgi:hypothetical protein
LNISRFQVRIAHSIFRLMFRKTVLSAIQFQIVTRLSAIEIQVVFSDLVLSSEFVGGKTAVS